jgi:tRNA G26 N,N-dimethylase Trm1
VFLRILEKHGLEAASPVPLVGRYSKSRPWSAEELGACVNAHQRSIPTGVISASLNRNPQDIIYRLLDECYNHVGGFREVGLRSLKKWDEKTISVGRELFEAGLTAWRVAALFGVDFEGAEKLLYTKREDYGHAKKNPFAICTDHKQIVNRAILSSMPSPFRILDAFAGEGRFSTIARELFPETKILCVEQDPHTFARAVQNKWDENTAWIEGDNLSTLASLAREHAQFDLIDLDPFVSCRDQIDLTWKLLRDEARLFVTFGGEYRRSFIGTNRKAIARRYGFVNDSLSNHEYLEVIPSYFLGWLAKEAFENGFIIDLHCAVRYPNNCRFWMSVRRSDRRECETWYNSHVAEQNGGFLWSGLRIPRFSEVRYLSPQFAGSGLGGFVDLTVRTKRKSKSQMEFML